MSWLNNFPLRLWPLGPFLLLCSPPSPLFCPVTHTCMPSMCSFYTVCSACMWTACWLCAVAITHSLAFSASPHYPGSFQKCRTRWLCVVSHFFSLTRSVGSRQRQG